MRKMRSLSFPKLSTPKAQGNDGDAMNSPYHFLPGHSRDSSSASSASSPAPSTFSSPTHSRWPGSNSSLDTAPESPINVSKAPLHDLVEDPEERDEDWSQDASSAADEPFCICDTTNCDHRKTITPSYGPQSPLSPEWTQGDDQLTFDGLADSSLFKRRKSGDAAASGKPRGHSRRWPSITKRWNERNATISLSNPLVRSAPPSRSASLQTPSSSKSLASHLGPRNPVTPPATPARSRNASITRSKEPPEPLDIKAPEMPEDPIDRDGQSSTPLLPPIMSALRRHDEEEEVQSPLQSPRVAHSVSAANTPISSPNLSTQPSMASITFGPHRAPQSAQDIPSMSMSDECDPWTNKLRHANFTISPEPYHPEICDSVSCNALLENWELARARYLRHAARISENYGPTSQIFKYTEQKWAEIDAVWRANLEDANAEAEACGQTPAFQSLAKSQRVSRIPTLNDPQQPDKFPVINEDEIVGPMVRYAKASPKAAKKSAFLRIFSSPASFLAARRRPSV